MSGGGLLRKAENLLAANGTDGRRPSGEAGAGISREDQQDILVHIDQVAQSNRILAGPDTWIVKPSKKGFIAPFLVNLCAAAVLAGGLYALWVSFEDTDPLRLETAEALPTAEGRLLQEIHREAEGRILEKDRQITAIQERMRVLDQERGQLLASVDDRIRTRELELRVRLAEELERERLRLVAAGLTQATIEERLRAFEREKTEALRIQLDELARRADEERLALQAELDRARAEFQSGLQAATGDRQRIVDESRRREQELRSQLDERNLALEADRARTAESLRTAQAELTRFNEEAAQARSAEDGLLGLYASVRSAMQEGRIEDAVRGAGTIRRYVADPAQARFPALSRRREVDLFTMDLVDRVAASERARISADSARVTDAMAAMGRIREEAARARAGLDAGNRLEAEAAYRRMLAALPELGAALAFLDEAHAARLSAQRAAAEAGRGDAADRAWAGLEAAYAAGDLAAFDAAYRAILAAAGLSEGRAAAALARARETGATAAFAARRASDTASATEPIRAAAMDLSARRYLEALDRYAAVMARFPLAEQAPRAAEDIRRSGRALADAFQEYRSESESRLRVLETRLAAIQEESVPAADRPAVAAVSVDIEGLRAERDRLRSELDSTRARLDALTAAFQVYAEAEDRILAAPGGRDAVAGWARLDAFLKDAAVSAALPGLRARVARYTEAFQEAGQEEVLFNAADIVEGAARIRDPGTRERFIRDMEARYSRNPSMLEFLQSVRESFS